MRGNALRMARQLAHDGVLAGGGYAYRLRDVHGRCEVTIRDLPELLKTAHRVVDEEWKKLTPERRKRICENLLKKAKARIEAKEKGGKA